MRIKKFEDFNINENVIKRGFTSVKNFAKDFAKDFFDDEPSFAEQGERAKNAVRSTIEENLKKLGNDAVNLFKKSYSSRKLDLKLLRPELKSVYDSGKILEFLELAGKEFVLNCLANNINDFLDMPKDVFPVIMSGAKTESGEAMFPDKEKNKSIMWWVSKQEFYKG